ncbi:hypothetical protein M23134_00137 [Microscilla marina ATCC 23134]|uniref:Uncharacterized protein n=2 Tax=Microscilla marina TaxID=1027 RepID=A1ZL17_MICM2|nr:hypothetical protein M23134_00137 [Microscilla marina ATCC 23134]
MMNVMEPGLSSVIENKYAPWSSKIGVNLDRQWSKYNPRVSGTAKKAKGPRVEIKEDEQKIQILISVHAYVITKGGKKVGEELIKKKQLSDVNEYLKGGQASFKHGGKVVEVQIDTSFMAVDSISEAKKMIKANNNVGVLLIFNGKYPMYKPNNRIVAGEEPRKGEVEVGRIAHELGHSLGFNERYIDTDGGALVMKDFKDDLMGTARDALNQKSIDNLIGAVLKNRAKTGDNYVGKPIDFREDVIEEKYKAKNKVLLVEYYLDKNKNNNKEYIYNIESGKITLKKQ